MQLAELSASRLHYIAGHQKESNFCQAVIERLQKEKWTRAKSNSKEHQTDVFDTTVSPESFDITLSDSRLAASTVIVPRIATSSKTRECGAAASKIEATL